MGKDSPKTPDPYATAAAQAQVNRINQISPTGNVLFGSMGPDGMFMPDYGRDAAQVTETGAQQGIREGRENLLLGLLGDISAPPSSQEMIDRLYALPGVRTAGNISSTLGSFPGLSSTNLLREGLPGLTGGNDIRANLPTVSNDYAGDIQQVQDATFDLGFGRLKPMFDERNRAMQTDLVNRGLPVGGEAYNSATSNEFRNQDESLRNLMMQSILAGRQEQGRLFDQSVRGRESEFGIGMGLAGLDASNRGQMFSENLSGQQQIMTERLQGLNEQLGLAGLEEQRQQNRLQQRMLEIGLMSQPRTQAMGEISALSGGMGTGPQTVGVPGIDVAGMISQNYATQANQSAANNQAFGGLLGTGMMAAATSGFNPLAFATGLPWSDIRLKTDIVAEGEENGFPVYSFRYRNDPERTRWRGVMAHEVARARPDAVETFDGYSAVNYHLIGVKFREAA